MNSLIHLDAMKWPTLAANVCKVAPPIIMKQPIEMAFLRPIPSLMNGAIGKSYVKASLSTVVVTFARPNNGQVEG